VEQKWSSQEKDSVFPLETLPMEISVSLQGFYFSSSQVHRKVQGNEK